MPRYGKLLLGTSLLIAVAAVISGCNWKDNAPAPAATEPERKSDKHAHKPGKHGGVIVSIGEDAYHAEAVFDSKGRLRLYIRDKDESKVMEIAEQTLEAHVKLEGGAEATEIELKPQPQLGDTPGKSSLFVGTLPESMRGQRLVVSIPLIVFGKDRFGISFKSHAEDHGGMGVHMSDAEERALYLTPGGLYTQADIEANGKMTASQKFKGFKAKHDLKPKPGDKLCPITFTKANPECAWIVNGKKYEFCCPPCVNEFVQMAKERSPEIKDPSAYVKPAVDDPRAAEEEEKKIQAALAKLTPEDRKLAEAQRFCAVWTDSRLGSMGEPMKLVLDGKPVFLCCEGCEDKARWDPAKTLQKVEQLKKNRPSP